MPLHEVVVALKGGSLEAALEPGGHAVGHLNGLLGTPRLRISHCERLYVRRTRTIGGSWLPMTEPRVKPSTFHSYKRNLELHMIPTLGQKPLQRLTPPMLTALYGQLAGKPTGKRG